MTLDESTDENDMVTTSGEVKVVYEKSLDEYLGDAEIDFEDTWAGKGFSLRGGVLGSC